MKIEELFEQNISTHLEFMHELDPVANADELKKMSDLTNEIIKQYRDYIEIQQRSKQDPNANVTIAKLELEKEEDKQWGLSGRSIASSFVNIAVPFSVLDYEHGGGAVYSKAWDFMDIKKFLGGNKDEA